MKLRRLLPPLLLVSLGAASASGVEVQVYLSTTGLGLLALPKQVIAAVATPSLKPQQTVAGILGAVDGGAEAQGWYMRASMAAPMVVNLGALNLTWQRGSGSGAAPGSAGDLLGVRLGVLNTTLPLTCDGTRRVVLQLDSQVGDYSAKLSRVGGTTDTTAARVEYVCTP